MTARAKAVLSVAVYILISPIGGASKEADEEKKEICSGCVVVALSIMQIRVTTCNCPPHNTIL